MTTNLTVRLALTIISGAPTAKAQSTGSLSGVVRVGQTPLANVTVDVSQSYPYPGFFGATTTGADGTYNLAAVPTGGARVWIVTPVGYEPVDLVSGEDLVTISAGQATTRDFELGFVPDAGVARGLGYWKHQVSALRSGHGQAQESYEDITAYQDRTDAFSTFAGGTVRQGEIADRRAGPRVGGSRLAESAVFQKDAGG